MLFSNTPNNLIADSETSVASKLTECNFVNCSESLTSLVQERGLEAERCLQVDRQISCEPASSWPFLELGKESSSRPSLTPLLLHLAPCDKVSLVPRCVPFSSGLSSLLPLLPPLEGLSFVPMFYCFQQVSLHKGKEQGKMGRKNRYTN